MISGSTALARAFALGLAPPPRLTVTEWADRHRRLPTKGSAEPGPWRTSRVPYTAEIMNCLSAQHPARRVVLIKSAQVAGTEIGLNWIGWFICTQRAPMMAAQPTIDVGERFSKQRVASMIDDCESLRELIPPARSRDSGNTTLLKEYPGGILIISGANSAASLRSLPIRYLFLDEVDAYPHDLDGEGDPISLAEARTTTFPRRKIFLCSTPTIESLSRIHKEWLASDQRRYHVPCPHCDTFNPLKWDHLHWPDGEPDKAAYACPACGAIIPEHHKTQMLAAGQWVAERPESPTPGFHLNGLYAPIGLGLTWVELAKEWEAKKRDPSQQKTFINTRLGECFADPDEKLDWDELKQRAEPYAPRTIPAGCTLITVGIDVQKNRFAVILLGHGRGQITWVIDYVELPADPTRPGDWALLDDVLGTTFPDAQGRQYPITAAAIDSGYLTDDVLNYSRQRRGKVIAVKGASTFNKPIISRPSKVDFNWKGSVIKSGAELWMVGHDTAKHQLFARLAGDRKLLPQDRLVHFPTGLDDSFYGQLTAEVWDSTRRRWVKIRPRNEALDCFTYAVAAAMQPSLRIHTWNAAQWSRWEERLGLGYDLFSPPLPEVKPAPRHRSPPPIRRQTVTRRITV
jgi:phage terminase large subunit GpA-like protein